MQRWKRRILNWEQNGKRLVHERRRFNTVALHGGAAGDGVQCNCDTTGRVRKCTCMKEKQRKKRKKKVAYTDEFPGCHHWTPDDIAKNKKWKEESGDTNEDKRRNRQRKTCKIHKDHVYTAGHNDEYPHCGECWCCMLEEKIPRKKKEKAKQIKSGKD
jgi:hypothetical protein